MKLTTFADILQTSISGQDVEIDSLCLDTRDLHPGQLFIALKGDQFDGHDFLPLAIEKKAAAAIVSTDVNLPIPTIKVADTRIALGKIAAHHRNQFDLPVIGITGSCGKTTTKTMLASILSQMGSTLAPEKSFNNDVGVPLTLMKLIPQHDYAVIEMGANHPGEIAYLSGIARQNIAVITNVAPAHLAGFGSVAGVANAKGEIYQSLPKEGYAIVNQDDAFAAMWLQNMGDRSVLTFGINNHADIMATDIVLNEEGRASFTALYPEGRLHIELPVLGNHNVINALAAIAAAYAVGANKQAIENGLANFQPVNKRLIRYQGQLGARIIDDTYNANPLSVKAALEILAHGVGEKIFVFGDMGELGSEEEKYHVEVGQHARKLGIDKLYACGKLSKLSADAFGENAFHYNDQAALIAALKKILHSKAVVLIKGSRSARMENVVQALIQES